MSSISKPQGNGPTRLHGRVFSLSNNSATHHSDLCDISLATLCHLLTADPAVEPNDTEWLVEQAKAVKQLPPSLLRPASLILRATAHLPCKRPSANLCRTHRPLSSRLIRSLFETLRAEVTSRLRRFTSRRGKRFALVPEVLELIDRLESLNGLWLSPRKYESLYPIPHREMDHHQYVENGCHACMLARVGGDISALRDLRAVLLARKRTARCEPRLLRVVESWIAWNSSGKAYAIFDAAEKLSRVVRDERQRLGRARNGRRRRTGCRDSQQGSDVVSFVDDFRGLLFESDEEVDGLEGLEEKIGLEEEIIDCYRDTALSEQLPGLRKPEHFFSFEEK